ncbi:MAG: hypothetical protein COV60_01145 [Candidatus Magasanikbacteria bacterium CG11_big_fil_rev_8_21_14_0_20_43_7]|uniref:Uncharacterized protein n=1 Tax=Candidatus Magasanikbacteria bacterium CG11_big_fil_rev_8_21_14_0_20_43_7 TaxID=1974654 RepID=A0A2H0N302_9BACT|nr:MAG: hypothetical protein COV60_01145 [Candidatus Magasanikbacteria bacterium CG11_big_fil_rev_8_21_14_0_20_43_7]
MNLYEFEGKQLFEKHGITIPHGIVVRRGGEIGYVFAMLGVSDVVVKAQVLSGKRGKNNAIRFCNSVEGVVHVQHVVDELFSMDVRGQYVASVRIEEKLDIAEEQYLSITYDTNAKQPVLVYSREGGVDIEDVEEGKIWKIPLDIRDTEINLDTFADFRLQTTDFRQIEDVIKNLWNVFLEEDCRLVEINPLVKTKRGEWVAADAKVAIDDDAFFRHSFGYKDRLREKGKDPEAMTNWEDFELRTMLGRPPTEREIAVAEIDKGEKYYQGTAGKYIEMDGDIATLFIGGGASIANMDALKRAGLEPANYTEYSGNPPREKVYELTKIVVSKPGLRGLWIAGAVSNFTNVKETFMGTADALAEVMPKYPIVVRRDGPFGKEGREYFMNFAKEKGLNVTWLGKDVSMSESVKVLVSKIGNQ